MSSDTRLNSNVVYKIIHLYVKQKSKTQKFGGVTSERSLIPDVPRDKSGNDKSARSVVLIVKNSQTRKVESEGHF